MADDSAPRNIEAEATVLGCILLDRTCIEIVAPIISPEDFYDRRNEYVYTAMISLYEKGEDTSAIGIQNYLQERDLLEIVGGTQYLAGLANSVATIEDVKQAAEIVQKMGTLRTLIESGNRVKAVGHDTALSPGDAINKAEKILYDVARRKTTREYRAVALGIQDTYDHISNLYGHDVEITGVPSGYEGLDEITQGFQDNNVIIFAGRPGSGKSALLFNIAINAAKMNFPVGLFSAEMSEQEVMYRLISAEANIEGNKLKTARMTEDEYQRFLTACAEIADLPIWIDDTPSLSVIELRSKARRMKAEHGIRIVLADYLQLLTASTSGNEYQQVSDVSATLRVVCRELGLPIVCGTQLNRNVEDRADKTPVLADLRSSGKIEQDAHVVIMVAKNEDDDPTAPDYRNLIVAKNRNGPMGVVKLRFEGQYTRFSDWDLKDGLIQPDDFGLNPNQVQMGSMMVNLD